MEFLLKGHNLLLLALMFGSGAVLIWPAVVRMASGGRDIGTLEATRLINNNALILDIRGATEFAAGHLPRAKHIPLAELESRLGELTKFKAKPIILNADTDLNASRALKLLNQKEFTDVYHLKGGISAWQEASLPLERQNG